MSIVSTQFLEKYILDDNRLQATFDEFDDDQEDYWFYTLLNLQTKFPNSDDPELNVWIKKVKDTPFGNSPSVKKLLLRQAVKDFSQATLKNCREQLGKVLDVNLSHVKADEADGIAKKAREYESTLNINTKKLISQKFNDGSSLIDNFKPAAAELIANKSLDNSQLGELLTLIENDAPDLNYLLTVVKKDLHYTGLGFGSRKIHYRLTKQQLDVLLDKDSSFLDDLEFLQTYARKMRPVSDTNLHDDPAALSNYLENLLQFVKKVKNLVTFRGCVIYNYMMDKEKQGIYDRKILKAYLKIPKNLPPGSDYQAAATGGGMEFNYELPGVPEVTAIGNDEPYVRRALTQFFIEGDKATPWAKEAAIDPTYALPLWAETMLVLGTGNEKFQAAQQECVDKYRGKGYFKKLIDRVDLELSPVNQQFHSVEEGVNISLIVKNNPTITVNVYEVCAKNYYVQRRSEIPTDLNLSGSMPIASFTKNYEDEPPLLKKPRVIEINQLRGKRGVFIIDLIGNGVGCRACVRKGQLRFVEKQCETGYIFKVVDEANREIKTGRVWCDGVDYDANPETGDILVPFGGEDDDHCMIIVEDSLQQSSATLSTFHRRCKKFRLETGFYVDRESMLEKRVARILMRPNLYLNLDAVSLKNIAKPTVTVTTIDNTGAKNTRVQPVELYDTRETEVEVLIPSALRTVEVVLEGEVNGKPVLNSQVFECNGIDNTAKIADMFLFPAGAAGYVLSVQGKNGEPFKDRVIDLTLTHRYFVDPIEVTVQSDHNGLIYLGRLVDVEAVEAKPRDVLVYGRQKWSLLVDKVNVPRVICARKGDTIKIPFISTKKAGPGVLIYDNDYIASFSKCYSYKKGFVDVNGLPAGDYTVFIRDSVEARVTLHVADGPLIQTKVGEEEVRYCVGKSRIIELSEDVPLQVTSVKGTRSRGYAITVEGVNSTTRLHVFMTSFVPRYTAFSLLAAPNKHPEVIDFRQVDSIYTPSASIASEYAYVMGRKAGSNACGNLLVRPTLLTGRWAPGDDPKREFPPEDADPSKFMDTKLVQKYKRELFEVSGADLKNLKDSSNMEFLGEQSRVYSNLIPDKEGVVTIDPAWISEQNRLIQIIAVDDDNTCVRNVILEESQAEFKLTDTRLNPGLDYTKHFTEARNVVCLPLSGDKYRINDLLTAEYEPFETLDEVFYLFRAVKGGESAEAKGQISRFEDLTHWDKLSKQQRLEFYDKNMSNEINYFMYRKDDEFFKRIVKPVVKNKLVKTFFDKWLLNETVTDYATNLTKLLTLNTFEKILLAEKVRIPSFTDATLRSIREQNALVPRNPQEEDRRFMLALASRQLSQDLMDASYETPAAGGAAAAPVEAEMTADVVVSALTGMGGPAPEAPKSGKGECIDTTKGYQERWYTDVPLAETTAALITPTPFWTQYASFVLDKGSAGAFLSSAVVMSTRNITEMLLALACTDLPFTADSPTCKQLSSTNNTRPVEIVAHKPVMVFIKEIVASEFTTSAISVSVNYFDPARRTEVVDGQEVDMFIKADEFLAAKVYGCRAVVTNVSSVRQVCELLIQIPEGAVPVNGTGDSGFRTKNFREVVHPFATCTKTFYFYFPEAGSYKVFPVHVNKNGATIGYSREQKILTVSQGSVALDQQSWEYIAQNATSPEVLDYLTKNASISNLDLTQMLWRLKEPKFFDSCTKILKERQIYDDKVWAYSLIADNGGAELGEFLSQNAQFRELAGPAFSSELVGFDGYAERGFQYTDFEPLVNPRTHNTKDMTSAGFMAQYQAFLNRVAFSSVAIRTVPTKDKIALCMYMIAQNRIKEAREVFQKIGNAGEKLCPGTYEYLKAYLSLFSGKFDDAVAIADKYLKTKHLPAKEKNKWTLIKDQAEESGNPDLADETFNEERYAKAAEMQKPMLDFSCEPGKLKLSYRNETTCTIEYWRMNLEVLFSAQPFSATADSFMWVKPNEVEENVKLPEGKDSIEVKIPQKMRNQNSIIRITTGSGLQVVKQDYDNSIVVQTSADKQEVRVLNEKDGKAVAAAYVKVYCKTVDGVCSFYKDGYTDLRGRFNFRQISTSKQMNAKQFALMITTDTLGSSKLELTV